MCHNIQVGQGQACHMARHGSLRVSRPGFNGWRLLWCGCGHGCPLHLCHRVDHCKCTVRRDHPPSSLKTNASPARCDLVPQAFVSPWLMTVGEQTKHRVGLVLIPLLMFPLLGTRLVQGCRAFSRLSSSRLSALSLSLSPSERRAHLDLGCVFAVLFVENWRSFSPSTRALVVLLGHPLLSFVAAKFAGMVGRTAERLPFVDSARSVLVLPQAAFVLAGRLYLVTRLCRTGLFFFFNCEPLCLGSFIQVNLSELSDQVVAAMLIGFLEIGARALQVAGTWQH